MITLKIDNLTVQAIGASTDRICYVLFPLDGPQGWMEALAQRLDVSIAVITGNGLGQRSHALGRQGCTRRFS